MAHQVFICHSSKDKLVADAACAALEAQRIPCWIAPRDILAGQEWGKAIIDAIGSCQVVLLIFSRHADASAQVRREVERAVSKGKILVPFRIEDVMPSDAMEYALGNTHWLDAITPPVERYLAELCNTISRVIPEGNISRPPASNAVFTPTQAPVVSPPQPVISTGSKTSSSRNLYLAVAVVLLAILGGFAYLHNKSSAVPTVPENKVNTTPQPSLQPTPVVRESAANTPPKAVVSKTPATPVVIKTDKTPTPLPNIAPAPVAAATPPPVPAELEVEIDGLAARASAINTSLDSLKASMQRSGSNMRGDIVAARFSMNTNLSKAQDAVKQRDADRARLYAGLTETNLKTLEQFLGR